jgi:protease-4
MAASGGYYLASTGAVIFADEASIVGSIGVVGGKVAAERALDRIGVHVETVPAKTGDRRAAARAAYESVVDPWDEPTRARLLQTMTAIYQLFLARVAEGRGISVDRVAESAEGRIFSGRDARGRGLVDELGGLKEAIARARTLANLDPDARVGVASEGAGLLEALAEDEPRTESGAGLAGELRGSDAPLELGRLLAKLASRAAPAPILPFVESLAPLASREHAVCALPFALTVQ